MRSGAILEPHWHLRYIWFNVHSSIHLMAHFWTQNAGLTFEETVGLARHGGTGEAFLDLLCSRRGGWRLAELLREAEFEISN